MGCCVSTGKRNRCSSPTKDKDSPLNRAPPPPPPPPPPPVEEETVKEVLSETPTVAKDKPTLQGETNLDKNSFALPIPIPIPSEVSKVCSLSESVSTTTDTTRREQTRRTLNRSPAKMHKNRSLTGERRSEQSPILRNVGSLNRPRRRDAAENSSRPSRSPANRADNGPARSVVGRSPSARRANESPARVRVATAESGSRKMESPRSEGKWASAGESLENPLVSLECFIFL